LAGRVSAATVLRSNEPLSSRTTLRVGGPADLYIEPASEQDLSQVLKFCRERGLKYFLLGRGSNLLIKEGGFRGAAICLAHPAFGTVTLTGTRLQCGAGAKLKAVCQEAKRNALSGLEFLEGIPGTIGGALRMNAGAMGGSIFDLVDSVRVMDADGQVAQVLPADMDVSYRRCLLLKSHVALGAVLRGRPGDRQAITTRMEEFSRKRWSSQPAASSAGCIFKNPATVSAGRLIDELGLKGTRVGGAMISIEHGNFLVNEGMATAGHVLELIELIRQRAKAERGIELETEVEVIGE